MINLTVYTAVTCTYGSRKPTRVPQKYWDLAFEYTCVTHAFNYHSAIKTSPYHLITGNHVILKILKAFWSLYWVHIALEDSKSKIGFPRVWSLVT